MQIKFPSKIKRAADAVRFVCAELSASGVANYIHYNDIVTVDICGTPCFVDVDFATHHVTFSPIQ